MAQAVKLCQECGQTSGFMDDRCRCGADLTGVPPTVQGLQNADAQP